MGDPKALHSRIFFDTKNKGVSEIDKIRPFWMLPTSVGTRRPGQARTTKDWKGKAGFLGSAIRCVFKPPKMFRCDFNILNQDTRLTTYNQ